MLLALSFPRYGHPACAWVALVPLTLALGGWAGPVPPRGQPTVWHGARLALLTGTVYFAGTCYWTKDVLATFGGLPVPVAYAAVLVMAVYLGLYVAFAGAVLGRAFARWGRRAFALVPVAWVASEYLRGTLFGGFPWVPLGNSQVEVLSVAQVASVVGVYGLSALVAAVNAVVAFVLTGRGPARVYAGGICAVALLLVAAWGTQRIADGSLVRQGTPLRVGLIQGNIDQADKWAPGQARRIFTTYLAMTRDAARRGAEYILWPESATPFMFEESEEGSRAIRELAVELRTPLLVGSDQIVRGARPRLYNAAFLVGPDGRTSAVYHKMHLVPFGEFIPFQDWLFFVSPLVDAVGQFSAGDSLVLLPVASRPTSTAICYEVVFPSLVRQAVLDGSELLTTITNDAWYGRSSAPYQHFAMASMRAIEQGRYLARAANTGISGVVDPYGRVVASTEVFTEAGVVAEVRLLQGRTIYSRLGDVVPQAALAASLLVLLVVRRRS